MIANESVYKTHWRVFLKMDLRVQMDAKSDQLKNQSKGELFSAPDDVQESAHGTTINAFDVCLMIQYRVRLMIHLNLHLKVKIHIKMHERVHLRLYSSGCILRVIA